MEIKEIITQTASDEIINKILDFQERIKTQYDPEYVIRSRKYRTNLLRREFRNEENMRRYYIFRDNKIVAEGYYFFIKPEIDTNPNRIEFRIYVDQEFTHNGYGKTLFLKLREEALKLNRYKLECWVKSTYEIGIGWLKKMGFKRVYEEKVNRLYRDKINYEFVKSKELALSKQLSDYKFMVIDSDTYNSKILNDKNFAKEVLDFLNHTIRLYPSENSTYKPQKMTMNDLIKRAESGMHSPIKGLGIFAFDKNKIIGRTLVSYPRDEELTVVKTATTAVRKEYQKKGIATFMKIKLIKLLENKNFKYIDTENAKINKAMLKINNNLGFEHICSWYQYEGDLRKINV